MPFGGGRQTRVVPRNHVLDGGQGRTNPFSRGDNALWHRRVGGSSSAVMPLLRFELSLLLHTPQQTPNAFKGRTSPTFFLPVRGFWLPSSNEWVRSFNRISAHYRLFNTWFRKPTSQFNKRNLDPFSRFCTAHPCAQHTHTHTHTQCQCLGSEVSWNRSVRKPERQLELSDRGPATFAPSPREPRDNTSSHRHPRAGLGKFVPAAATDRNCRPKQQNFWRR